MFAGWSQAIIGIVFGYLCLLGYILHRLSVYLFAHLSYIYKIIDF